MKFIFFEINNFLFERLTSNFFIESELFIIDKNIHIEHSEGTIWR